MLRTHGHSQDAVFQMRGDSEFGRGHDMETRIIFEEEITQSFRVVKAARNTVARIHRELASGGRFHPVMLEELERALRDAGEHPCPVILEAERTKP